MVSGRLLIAALAAILCAAPGDVRAQNYLHQMRWQMTTAGGPCSAIVSLDNPKYFNPDQSGSLDPWLLHVIADPIACTWSQVTFTQVAGPQPGVFPTITVMLNEVNGACQSLLNADCAPILSSPANPPNPGVYTIAATVTGALGDPGTYLGAANIIVADTSSGGGGRFELQPGRNYPTSMNRFGQGRSENIDIGDVDNDGDYDVVIANGGDGSAQANRIYVNNGGLQGGTQGTFSDRTGARFSGVPNDTSRDIELADFDGDCDLDIYVANRGNTTNGGEVSRAYINLGGAQFGTAGFFGEDTNGFWGNLISVPAGDQVFGGNNGPWRDFSCDCDFGDLDLDGDLDLFHSSYGPNINGTDDSRIFLNDGDGNFDELWPWANAGADIKTHTLDLDLVDLDNDWDFDIFMSSRDSQARVYRNNLNTSTNTWPGDAFTDVTQSALIATGATLSDTNNYECEFGDLDGDGNFDIYAVNYAGFGDRVLRNNGNLTFIVMDDWINGDPNVDESEADFLDFDSDGDLDVFMANFSGTNFIHANSLAQGLSPLLHRTGTSAGNSLYPNAEVPASGNGGTTLDGEAADMDGDGDPDLLLANDGNQNNRYWENVLGVPDTHAPIVHQITRESIGGDHLIRVQLRDNANYYVISYYNVDLLYTVNSGVENRVRMFSQGSQQFQAVIPGAINGNISYRIAGSDDHGNAFVSGSTGFRSSGSGVVLSQNIDDGTYGSNGKPYLIMGGSFDGGSVVSANLCDAKNNASAALFASLSGTPTLFKGGLLYTVPILIAVVLNTGANSQIYFEAAWPAGMPAGTALWFQYGVDDAAGTGGAALSNAVKITMP